MLIALGSLFVCLLIGFVHNEIRPLRYQEQSTLVIDGERVDSCSHLSMTCPCLDISKGYNTWHDCPSMRAPIYLFLVSRPEPLGQGVFYLFTPSSSSYVPHKTPALEPPESLVCIPSP